MANLNSSFQRYNENLSITQTKRNRLISAKASLITVIEEYFKENHTDYQPTFFIQGSYKTNTMIRTKDDTCDLDLNVIFHRVPDVASATLQTWVRNAVVGHTNDSPSHLKKCIRVHYAGEFHIDLPVFYKLDSEAHLNLAVKGEGWQLDDPKEFVEWFNAKKDADGQLLRTVRFLKGWADHKRGEMPSGLAMTILASGHMIYSTGRDDIALTETLKQINYCLTYNHLACTMPTTPKDDLFAGYSQSRRGYFLNALSRFIQDAEQALESTDSQKAANLWAEHLGDRFPR